MTRCGCYCCHGDDDDVDGWSPYVIGQTIIFLPCGFFLLSFFLSSPNLSGRRLDVYRTSFLFMLLPLLLTLSTHHSHHPLLPLSFTPGSRPTSSTDLSPIDSLPASGLTPRTSRLDRFFWASPFYVFSFFIILFLLGSVRQTKLASRQLLGAR